MPGWLLQGVGAVVITIGVLASASSAQDTQDATACGQTAQRNALTGAADDAMRPLSADYHLDTDGSLNFSGLDPRAFRSAPCQKSFSAPVPGEALWLRFTVTNAAVEHRTVFVAFGETIYGHVTAYLRRADGSLRVLENGRSVPPADRADKALLTAIPLALGPGEPAHVHLRIAGTTAPTVTPILMSADLFRTSSTTMVLITSLFMGFLTAILVVSLILFRHVAVASYQFYALYILSVLAYSFVWEGWLNQVTSTTVSVAAIGRITEVIASVSAYALCRFCRVLLTVDSARPGLKRLFDGISIAIVVVGVVAVLDPWTFGWPANILGTGLAPVMLVVALIRARDGLPQAKPLVISFLCLFAGLTLANWFFHFPNEVRAPDSVLELLVAKPVDWGFYLAILAEASCMAFAIAAKVRSEREVQASAAAAARTMTEQIAAERDAYGEQLKTTEHRIETLETRLIEDSDGQLLSPEDTRFVNEAVKHVTDHLQDPTFGARDLASALGTSEKTLGRRLKRSVGQTPAAFIRAQRMERARDLILARQFAMVSQVSYAVGFTSTSHFAKVYRAAFGETPNETLKAAVVARPSGMAHETKPSADAQEEADGYMAPASKATGPVPSPTDCGPA